jgi:hypothetical protein
MIAPAPFSAPKVAPPLRAPADSAGSRGGALFLIFPALALALTTANANLTIAAVLSLAVIIRLLWRPGQPPALLLACGLQWLQGAMLTLEANFRGVELWTLSYSRSLEAATYLTLGWSVSVAVGAWLVTRRLGHGSVAPTLGLPIAMERLLFVYGAWTVIVGALGQLNIASITQLLNAIAVMRWALLFAIFTYGWQQPGWLPAIFAVLFLEIAAGTMSFFSEFRLPLYVFALALATVGYRPTLRMWIGGAIVLLFTLYLSVIWTAIKMDYRDRLSGGRGHRSQVVRIGVEERAAAFVELVGTVDEKLLGEGVDMLMRRMSYVEYFSYVIDYVPAVVDHERGAVWSAALSHVLMPRVLFPDKVGLPDETALTERYTGLDLASGSGTSISIGIPGEAYIDFAESGVVGLGLLFGVMFGLAYRYFITQRQYSVLAQGMAVALCLSFGSVENGAVKSIGALLTLTIVGAVGWRLVLPALVPWLTAAGSQRKR